MTGQITLLDLPSRDPCSTWSLNPWKTRMLLNFKNLDYKTEWTEYPDIEPKFKPHLPPNESGTRYTIPTVILPDGTWLMESRIIANHIEKNHPSPPMHMDSPFLAKVDDLVSKIFDPIRAICYVRVPANLLNEASLEYWQTTRQKRVGMSLEEFERRNGGEVGYAASEPHLKEMTALLKENSGPFFMGQTVSYADFVWVSALVFFRRVDEAMYEEMLKRTGDRDVHVKLLGACEAWLTRNDH